MADLSRLRFLSITFFAPVGLTFQVVWALQSTRPLPSASAAVAYDENNEKVNYDLLKMAYILLSTYACSSRGYQSWHLLSTLQVRWRCVWHGDDEGVSIISAVAPDGVHVTELTRAPARDELSRRNLRIKFRHRPHATSTTAWSHYWSEYGPSRCPRRPVIECPVTVCRKTHHPHEVFFFILRPWCRHDDGCRYRQSVTD